MIESWEARHFSLSNPAGDGQEDIAALLHRLADSIQDLGDDVVILDITFASEVGDGRDLPAFTVYFNQR